MPGSHTDRRLNGQIGALSALGCGETRRSGVSSPRDRVQGASGFEHDCRRVAQRLAEAGSVLEFQWVATCDSTNTRLLEASRSACRSPTALAAWTQTNGRGRHGARWLAEPGRTLCFSLLWPSRRPAADATLVPLAAGVACAQSVLRCANARVRLKWPNDLITPDGKLGGILVETGRSRESTAVIVGVGINLIGAPELEASLKRPVADLRDAGGEALRAELLAELLLSLERWLQLYESRDDEVIRGAWSGFDGLRDREVCILGSAVRGIARGVGTSGALRLETSCGTVEVHAGEARLLHP